MRVELGHGVVFEGTPEEIRKAAELMGVKFPKKAEEEAERLARVKQGLDGTYAHLTSDNVRVDFIETECFGDDFRVVIMARNVR